MINNGYSEKLLKHFRNPHNLGKIDNADGVGQVGNPVCGDVMKLYLKVKEGKIGDIKFETYGCAAAIATSSVITDLAKGRTVEEALKITKDDVIRELDYLPPIKVHCSLLAIDALAMAVGDYFEKRGLKKPDGLGERMEMIRKKDAVKGCETGE